MTPVLQRTVQLERLSSAEIADARRESGGVALIPVGAVEVHGPHLPLGTDTIETYEIALRAAQQAQVVVVPPLWYGNSRSFMDFPGTITVRPETLRALVTDVAASLLAHGFDRPVILDGHGGNYGVMELLAEDLHLETGALICHVRAWELATVPKPEGVPAYDGHGGSSETSVMMVLTPDDVHADRFADSRPEIAITRFGAVFPGPSGLYSGGAATFPLQMGEMVELGHHGDPAWASRERGEALLRVKVDALVEFLTALKGGEVRLRSGEPLRG